MISPPTLGPDLTPPVLGNGTGRSFLPSRKSSGSSVSLLNSAKEKDVVNPMVIRRSTSQSSSSSIPFISTEVELVTEEGVRHSDGRLDARHYKTPSFARTLLHLIQTLRVPTWTFLSADTLTPEMLKVSKVSGSLTNAVFFVSCPSIPSLRTILLRIYGPSSSNLISRPRELHTLHILSSEYRIGPRVYGTFENGRMEEYFDSVTLSGADLRDPKFSRWIGARMAELHCVDIEAIEDTTPATRGENIGWKIAARKNVRSWLAPARQVLSLPTVPEKLKSEIQLDVFLSQWEKYMAWVTEWETEHGASKRVFAHNDAQYGNLLCLSQKKEGIPEHHRIIVVDFEYAAPNPAAFDIANHFHEWTANYHGSTPHILDASRYPNETERRNFYHAYLTHACPPLTTVPLSSMSQASPSTSASSESEIPMDIEAEMQRLEEQVRVWSPASHAMWAIWGIVQAMEDMEAARTNPEVLENLEFDYLGYAQCRMEGFRREIEVLHLS